jgi:hypothetical protein
VIRSTSTGAAGAIGFRSKENNGKLLPIITSPVVIVQLLVPAPIRPIPIPAAAEARRATQLLFGNVSPVGHATPTR